nr:hypothetical protein [Kibdelosporangium sp. MJ126-NF4]
MGPQQDGPTGATEQQLVTAAVADDPVSSSSANTCAATQYLHASIQRSQLRSLISDIRPIFPEFYGDPTWAQPPVEMTDRTTTAY